MSREPDIYDQLCRSIAPSIYGSENVKKVRVRVRVRVRVGLRVKG